MRPTDIQLLEVWERGFGRPPAEQALVLLGACDLRTHPAALMELSVGDRDRHLLRLRQTLFGESAVVTSRCPACAEQVEIGISIGELILETRDSPQILHVECDSWRIACRVPLTGDLLAVQHLPPGKRRRALMQRCIEHGSQQDETAAPDQIPAELMQSVVDAMAEADPQANLEFELRCSNCGHAWVSPFDIVSFLWREINDWAHRQLLQIHALAKAYGWTQEEILRLSRWRRQVYLGMARQ